MHLSKKNVERDNVITVLSFIDEVNIQRFPILHIKLKNLTTSITILFGEILEVSKFPTFTLKAMGRPTPHERHNTQLITKFPYNMGKLSVFSIVANIRIQAADVGQSM